MSVTLTSQRLDIAWSVLLEQQLQWVDVVELDARHTSDEPVRHGLVLANVHVLNIVKLSVGRVLDVKVILLRFVVVDLFEEIHTRIRSKCPNTN